MTTPSPEEASSYSWLNSDDRPGLWIRQASCFTFLRPVPPESVLAGGNVKDVQELDLSSSECALDDVVESEQELDIAVFEAGNGWTVIYQDNGFPAQFANTWLASAATEQGVVVFWNVNGVTEFSLWERGEKIVGFDVPYERHGTEPDRLNSDMEALGIPVEEPSEDDAEHIFTTYAQRLALAERVTGVRLDEDFLARRVIVGRTA